MYFYNNKFGGSKCLRYSLDLLSIKNGDNNTCITYLLNDRNMLEGGIYG